MARTYSNTPVLSKIKIGDSYYYLKDADVRGILDSINSDVYASLQLALGTVSNGGNNLVTAANIKSYVDSALQTIPEFDVVVVGAGEDLPTASADTFHKIYLKNASGEAEGNLYVEYITVRSGSKGAYTYSWEKIGDTALDLSGYVTDIKYDSATHKLQKQKGEGAYQDVHTFGAMADANSAQGTVTDYVTGVSSAKVTAAGNISGNLVKDSVNGVQISGTVAAPTVTVELGTKQVQFVNSVGTLPSKAADSFKANKPTLIDTSKFSGGSKAADTFKAASLETGFFSAGTAASFKEGAFTPASIATKPTASFAKEGIKASVGAGADAECLIFESVATGSAVTDVTINGGSKAKDTFTANTPAAVDVSKFNGGSFTEGKFTAAKLNEGFYTAGTAATYSEGLFDAGTLPTLKAAENIATGIVSKAEASAPIFTGDKFGFTGSFAGTEVNASVTLSKGNKTITVTPKA